MPHDSALRRARIATMFAFATNGAMTATLLARYAEVKDLLGLDPAVFGLLVVGLTVGGAAAFQLPAAVLRRFGTPRTTTLGTLWCVLALTLAAVGVTLGLPWLFFLGLFLSGFGDACVDVGQNSQGLRVQEAYGRSLLNVMHAGWSIGAAVGGGVGTLAALAQVPLIAHIAVWGGLCVLLMGLAARNFLPESAAPREENATASLRGRHVAKLLVPLALVALAGISVEEFGGNWSAVLLNTERGVEASAAGVAVSVVLGAQFVGRLLGDRAIDRLGERWSLLLSLSAVVVGLLGAAVAPNAPLTLFGLVVAGLGSAVTVPVAFARADAVPGLPPHSGVTWVSFAMRAATIGLSPAIGGLGSVASLPVAMMALSAIALVALTLQVREPKK